MARTKNRSSAHTCPRCAALLIVGSDRCGLCQFDLTTPVAPVVAPVVAPTAPSQVPAEPVETAVSVVDEPVEAPAPPPVLELVTEPADAQEYTSTSVFLPLPHELPVSPSDISTEPTPLAPVELLDSETSVDFTRFNPRDPFSWYPVIQA